MNQSTIKILRDRREEILQWLSNGEVTISRLQDDLSGVVKKQESFRKSLEEIEQDLAGEHFRQEKQ